MEDLVINIFAHSAVDVGPIVLENSLPETEPAETEGIPEIFSGSADELETHLVSVFIPFVFHRHARNPSHYKLGS